MSRLGRPANTEADAAHNAGALATLRELLNRAVAELPADELCDLVGVLASATARAQLRLTTPAPAPPATLVGALEMARLLDVPENWVRDKARTGALPFHQLGHYVRFSPTEVLEAVRRMPAVHDCAFRGLKKRTENRGGARRVSTECPKNPGVADAK